jgi:nucleoside-diphosphate-sugar epimerase
VPRLVHISTEALLVRDGRPIHLANEERELQEPPFHAPYSISKLRAEKAVLVGI